LVPVSKYALDGAPAKLEHEGIEAGSIAWRRFSLPNDTHRTIQGGRVFAVRNSPRMVSGLLSTAVEAVMRESTVVLAGLALCMMMGMPACKANKPDETFCVATARLDMDLAELNAIGPHSTVAELRAASDRTEYHVATMQRAAARMKTPAAQRFTAATKQLKRDIEKVPEEATLEQVYAAIAADAQNARAARDELAGEAGCPISAQPPG
jgi:hypothetical protein